jgi:hypothetical protein
MAVTPYHEDGCTIGPSNPSSVSLPKRFIAGSLAPLIGAAYTYWFIGAKQESKGQGLWSVLCAAEEPPGSGLSPKITASYELATCGGPAAKSLG